MIVLSIRTDKAEAELGLFYDQEQKDYMVWHADRELSLTILQKMEELLGRNDVSFQQLEGLVVFTGPGSFTGLRIGISVANALAHGLGIAVLGSETESWIQDGINRIQQGENQRIALPHYNRSPNITQPKK